MKIKNSTEQLLALKKQLRELPLALIMPVVLFATSCKSSGEMTRTDHLDTLQVRKKQEMALSPVPMSRVRLTIPMPELRALPPNAVFSDRSGQASVRASIQGDTVYIDATCDSLQRMVLKQSEELTRIRSETTMQDKQAKIVREPTGWQWFWIRMGQLAIVYLIFRITKQYLNKKIKLWQ